MVLKIRLARFGKRNAPFYNIVVAQARYQSKSHDGSILANSRQNGQKQQTLGSPRWLTLYNFDTSTTWLIEAVVGTYDPIPKPPPLGEGKLYKDIKLDTARAKYWLGVGAQPSDPAWRLLSRVGLYFERIHFAENEADMYSDRLDYWNLDFQSNKCSKGRRRYRVLGRLPKRHQPHLRDDNSMGDSIGGVLGACEKRSTYGWGSLDRLFRNKVIVLKTELYCLYNPVYPVRI